MQPSRTDLSDTTSLLSDIVSQTDRILRREAALAKAEMCENLLRPGVAIMKEQINA